MKQGIGRAERLGIEEEVQTTIVVVVAEHAAGGVLAEGLDPRRLRGVHERPRACVVPERRAVGDHVVETIVVVVAKGDVRRRAGAGGRRRLEDVVRGGHVVRVLDIEVDPVIALERERDPVVEVLRLGRREVHRRVAVVPQRASAVAVLGAVEREDGIIRQRHQVRDVDEAGLRDGDGLLEDVGEELAGLRVPRAARACEIRILLPEVEAVAAEVRVEPCRELLRGIGPLREIGPLDGEPVDLRRVRELEAHRLVERAVREHVVVIVHRDLPRLLAHVARRSAVVPREVDEPLRERAVRRAANGAPAASGAARRAACAAAARAARRRRRAGARAALGSTASAERRQEKERPASLHCSIVRETASRATACDPSSPRRRPPERREIDAPFALAGVPSATLNRASP